MPTINIMLCVNNPRNGMFSGRVCGIDIDDLLRLESRIIPEPRCTFRKDGTFSVHHCRCRILNHHHWVGNWCWDLITVSLNDAAKLLHSVLLARQQDEEVWSIDQAEGEDAIALMDLRKRDIPITIFDLDQMLRRHISVRSSLAKGGTP